jgi:hypothetical protein
VKDATQADMMPRTPHWPLIALLFAMFCVLVAFLPGDRHGNPVPALAMPAADGVKAPAARPKSIGEEYRQSRDLWAFFLRHAQSTRDGPTLYFLSQALEECYVISHALDDTDLNRKWREVSAGAGDALASLAAKELLAAPCRGFGDQPIDARDVLALIAESAAMEEPRALARMLLFRDIAAPKDELAPLLQELLASRDPAVVRDVGAFLSRGETEWLFGGQAIDAHTAAIAWELAACDLGFDCGAGSRLVRTQCALNGVCRAGSYEMALSFLEDPGEMHNAQQVRSGIVKAISEGDWDWLGLGESSAAAPR